MDQAARLGPDFWRLWGATVVSSLGDGIRVVALPLLAARLTRDPLAVSAVTVATWLPWLFALVTGAFVERSNLRSLMLRCCVLQTVAMVGMAGVVGVGASSVPLLVVVPLLVGTAQTCVDLAAQAALPTLVPRSSITFANGRLQAGVRIVGLLAGSALGGVLLAWSAAVPFVVDAVSFAAAAMLVRGIRSDAAGTAVSSRPVPRSLRHIVAEIGEGARWLWRNRVLRTLCGVLMAWSIADTAVMAVLGLLALESLHLPEAAVGVLLAAAAAGGIVGSLAAPRLVTVVRPGTTVGLVLAAVAVAYAALGSTASPLLAVIAMLLFGAGSGAWVVVATSLRQSTVPHDLLARVSGAYRFAGFGTRPLGALLGGLTAQAWGVRFPAVAAAVVTAGAGMAAVVVLRRASPAATDHV